MRAVGKQELFADSDVMTIHMPLSERSRGLVGAAELAAMKPTGISGQHLARADRRRGGAARRAARGRIAGAGLDVYDVEPLPVDHPLRSMPNTLLLPHIGYVTTDNYRTWYGEVVEDIVAWAAGKPIRVLNS